MSDPVPAAQPQGLDLGAIEQRNEARRLGLVGKTDTATPLSGFQAVEDVRVLIAEVRRLRDAYGIAAALIDEIEAQRQALLDLCDAVDRTGHGRQHVLADLVSDGYEPISIPWTRAVRVTLGVGGDTPEGRRSR